MDINKVHLLGRLTHDPTSTTTKSGQQVTRFGVATNYTWRDMRTKEKQERSEFHTIVTWGKLADIAATYLKRGSRIFVTGRIQYRTWEDKDKQKRNATNIVADELIMLGHRNGKEEAAPEALVKEEPTEELVTEEE